MPAPYNRVAIYARYSSDNQSEASIDDQLRLCKERASKEDWSLIECYSDRAISGASLIRSGVQSLIADALTGRFDIILVEALDRLSRDQEDIAGIYKRMEFAGVKIITLSEGEINQLHVGLKGTMNALFLKDLADKTRRGLRGRVEAGKSGGGNSYGYDVIKSFDDNGKALTGDRRINKAEAQIIRRIFTDFADGKSPRHIAHALNAEGIPGPRARSWTGSTIRGHHKRGTGILNNELYMGKLVWNKLHYRKDPDTGKRISRLNPKSDWIIKDVPELKFIDQELWGRVKARQGEIRVKYKDQIDAIHESQRNNRLNNTHRHKHLLSGLLTCGSCGGRYSIICQNRYGCFNHTHRGNCPQSRSIMRTEIEDRVLTGLKDKLLHPDVVHRMIKYMQEEANRLQREKHQSYDLKQNELAKVEKQIDRLVMSIANGTDIPSMHDLLFKLEEQKQALKDFLDKEPPRLPDLHPGLADVYRDKVIHLTEALNSPDTIAEASGAIRALIDKIIITVSKQGKTEVALHGELDALLHFMTATKDQKTAENKEFQNAESRPSSKEGRLYCVRGCGDRI